MLRAVKLRLYPNKLQEQLFINNVGCCRFVYNHFLDMKIEYSKANKRLSCFDMHNKLTDLKIMFPWLKDVCSQSLKNSINNLEAAFNNFFRGLKTNKYSGFPKFKKKNTKDSFKCTQSLDVNNSYLRIGKHGWIKTKGNIQLLKNKLIKNIVVSCVAKKWFASCVIEVDENKILDHKWEECGIDIGVKKPLVVAYDNNKKLKIKVLGKKFSRDLRKKEHRRKLYQKALARKQKGSKNREKARLKLSLAYVKEANYRKEWVEQTSDELTKVFKIVKFENLKLQKMTGHGGNYKRKLNNNMRRLGFGMLINRCEQKAEERGGNIVYISPHYTSQKCAECGFTSKKNRKNQAKFKCVVCKHKDNADYNAAKNILAA